MIALLLAAAVLPAPRGPLAIRPGTYAPRGAACAACAAGQLRYDGRILRDRGGRVVARRPRVHGPEGFTLGVRGRGGATFGYCRPDDLTRARPSRA